MTTIATDGKTLAGDRRGTTDRGCLLTDSEVKLFIEPWRGEACAWGFAGEWWAYQKFLHWVRECAPADKQPAMPESFEALQMTASGRVFYWEKALVPEFRNPPCAIGSGWPFALGAMKAGLPPEDAVQVAKTCDVYTGGDVDVITLDALRSMKQAAE